MSSKTFNPFKDFQSDQIQRSSRKIFTAHYACRNAALNLTPVMGTTNGFIFQIINSLIESWGVCLTCFDCNQTKQCMKSPGYIPGLRAKSLWCSRRWQVQIIAIQILCLKNPTLDLNHTEALPGSGGGGRTHVARLHFKTSHVGVYKFFTYRCWKLNENSLSLSEF